MTVYEYVDDNAKADENCLTVDFYFDSDVTLKQAEKIVDKMVADNFDKIKAHTATIFVKSPFLSNN